MITLKQVAALANVSQATASLVLNGRAEELKISSASSARVREAAEALGYHGNYHARTLSTGRTHTLGLVCSGVDGNMLSHRFFGPYVAGVSEAARAQGYNLLLINPDSFFESYAHAVSFIGTRRVDALIVIGPLSQRPSAPRPLKRPIVYLNAPPAEDALTVNVDPAPGIEQAVAHLEASGHRDILWIGSTREGVIMYPERAAAFRRACAEAGITAREWSVQVDTSYSPHVEENIARYRQALADGLCLAPSTTAIMCLNDTMGLALYAVLADRGLHVPDDLSIIGFDDLHAAYAIPAMTTISHMLREMGATAVTVVLERLQQPDEAPFARDIRVPARLVVRQSTRVIPWEC